MTIIAHHVSVTAETFTPTVTLLTSDGYIWQGTGLIAKNPVNLTEDEQQELEYEIQANDTLKTLFDIPQFLEGCKNSTPEDTLNRFMLTNNMANYLNANGVTVIPVYAPDGQFGEAFSSKLPADLRGIAEDLKGKTVYLYQVYDAKYVNSTLGYPMIGYVMRAKVV